MCQPVRRIMMAKQSYKIYLQNHNNNFDICRNGDNYVNQSLLALINFILERNVDLGFEINI